MHFLKKRGVFVLALWVMGAGAVFAQSGVVRDIVFSGLKRTKPLVAERLLEKFRGLRPDAINENDVRAAIIESGVLDPEKIAFLPQDGDYTLHAVVVEKMSFFPVPIFLTGSNGWMAGLALADVNAFGQRDTFVLSGTYAGDARFAVAMYAHPGVVAEKPGFMLSGSYSYSDFEGTNAYGDSLFSMKCTDIGVSAGITGQFSALWSGRLILGYNYRALELPDRIDRFVTAQPQIGVRRSAWDGYLLNENSASLGYAVQASPGTVNHRLSVTFRTDTSIVSGFRFTAKGGAVWIPDSDIFTEISPDATNVTIMTGDFRAANMAGLSAGLEKALFRVNAGTLAVLAAYQILATQSLSDGDSFDHGAFAGIQFYLRRVAIPAVGLGASFNPVRKTTQWSFGLGMQF
jgi:hypothetical protein